MKYDNSDIDEYDEDGHTPLMKASIAGDYEEVKRLLDLGADPNKRDRDHNSANAESYAARQSKKSDIHKKIEKLLIESNSHSDNKEKYESKRETREEKIDSYTSSSITLSGWLYLLGFISLILAPFTGITVVTAAAFFVIAWILDH